MCNSKKNLALAISCLLVAPVFAADGTLTVTGKVIEHACSLESEIHHVAMGDVRANAMGSEGMVLNPVPFALRLINCSQRPVTITFEGTPIAGVWGWALDNAEAPETAKNVALAIWGTDNGKHIGFLRPNKGFHWSEASDNLTFEASYSPMISAEDIKPGNANVSLQITLTQL